MILLLHGILTGKFIYSIIWVIEGQLQGLLQGQNVNSYVIFFFFQQTQLEMKCNISF